jgi:IS5 family transposase
MQKDVDARWTKKHGKSHNGYKNHVNVDRKHKLVRRYHVSDAALHDSQAVDHLLSRATPVPACGRTRLIGPQRWK